MSKESSHKLKKKGKQQSQVQATKDLSTSATKKHRKRKHQRNSTSHQVEDISIQDQKAPNLAESADDKGAVKHSHEKVPSKATQEPSSQSDVKGTPFNHHLLVGNIKGVYNGLKLREYLNENGIKFDGLQWITHIPMALVKLKSVSRLNEVKTKLQDISENSQPVGWMELSGNVEPFIQTKSQAKGNSLFVSHLPPNVSKVDLRSLLPTSINSHSCEIEFIFDCGKKFIGAKMSFDKISDVTKAKEALNIVDLGCGKLKVTKFFEQEERNIFNSSRQSMAENSDSCTLLMRNVPSDWDTGRLEELFPSANSFDLKQVDGKSQCIVKFSDSQSCHDALHTAQGMEINASIMLRENGSTAEKAAGSHLELGTFLRLENIPFSCTESQIMKEFPTASKVFLKKHANGMSAGIAFLSFNSLEDSRAVYEACKQTTINGRKIHCYPAKSFPKKEPEAKKQKPQTELNEADLHTLRVSNAPFTMTDKDMKKYFPDAVKIKLVKDDNGSSKGVFLVSFVDSAVCQASRTSIFGTKVDGRILRCEMVQKETDETKLENTHSTLNEPNTKKRPVPNSPSEDKKPPAKKLKKSKKSDKS